MTQPPFGMDPSARFDDEVARIARGNDADVVFQLVRREDSTMARCSFGHDAEEVREYQVTEKAIKSRPGGPSVQPSKALDTGRTCPKHAEMISTAKFDRQQDKRLAAAQRFHETSAPNEHTAAVEKSFELDKPAGKPNSHETYISMPVRDRRPRDDRDNIERDFGRDLLQVDPLIVQIPLQGLGGERVLRSPSLPAPGVQCHAQGFDVGTSPQAGGAANGIAERCRPLGGELRIVI